MPALLNGKRTTWRNTINIAEKNTKGENVNDVKVSIFASAVRPQFFRTFLDSLVGTTESCEVIFAGHNTLGELLPLFPQMRMYSDGISSIDFSENVLFKYIHTGKIKPAQCYEIARRACVGETIAWTADDAVHTPDLYGKAYRFWKEFNDEKIALSIQTEENRQYCNMNVHSFFGCRFDTPLMAPLALMSNKVMQDLGGFDRRYICGQYENDAIMRLIEAGGRVVIFGDRDNKIILDHYARHGIHRPFAKGYNHDREILEGSWTNGAGKVFTTIQRPFEPYEDTDILTKSQSFNLSSLWV